MYYRIAIIVLGLLVDVAAQAQRQNNIWYFGELAGLDFNSGAPVALSDSRMQALEGCASIADRTTGRLLFYTNGLTVWNRYHQVMPNGNALKGHWSSTMSSLIVAMPGDSTRYYLFTTDAGYYTDPPHEGLNYSIVDMKLDSGRGDISVKNVRLADTAAEKVVAIRECGDPAYWIVTRAIESNGFYAFHLTRQGMSMVPVISYTGLVSRPNALSSLGYMKASPDGRKLAVAFNMHDTLELYDFNLATGVVSNPIQLRARTYGLSFSPDNTRLYAFSDSLGRFGLAQFDLTRPDRFSIASSMTMVANLWGGGALQIGPDGKIYCAGIDDTTLSVIEKPNELGKACSPRFRSVDLKGRVCKFGLPNLIDGEIFYTEMGGGPDATICAGESVALGGFGGVRYRWLSQQGLPCTDCPSPVVSPTLTTSYVVHIANNVCEMDDTVLVTVMPLPKIEASQFATICPGDTAQLNATGADEYHWSPADGLSCIDCPAPRAYPFRTTTYTVVGINSNGCRDSLRVVVSVGDTLAVDAGRNVVICAGDSTRLHVTPGSGYRWSPAQGLSCTDCPDPVASPSGSTLYSVFVSNWSGSGCPGSDTVRVGVLDPSTVDAGKDVSICSGDTIGLHASGDGIFHWSPSDSLSCADCASPRASPSMTTTYRLSVTSDSGCSVIDSVTVIVLLSPDVDAGVSRLVCRGDSVVLNATGGIAYHWSPGAGLSCSDCPSPVARPDSTTIYHVTATGSNGCHGTDTVTVAVVDAGGVDAGTWGAICSGDSLRLHASDGLAWHWSPSDGLSCSDCRDPLAGPMATTRYSVAVTVPGGCIGSDTVTVVVYPSVDAGADITACAGERVQLHAGRAEEFHWNPAEDLSCATCSDPIASPSATTVYHLSARNSQGCTSTDSVVVTVHDADVVRAHIDRDHHAASGPVFELPVLLDDAITTPGIDTVTFMLGYDPGLLRLLGIDRAGTLLDRWSATTLDEQSGMIRLRLNAPQGEILDGSGQLLRLRLQAFLGSTPSSELPFSLKLNNACVRVETMPGMVVLDSICGLDDRLMEIVVGTYSLDQNEPNPFNPTTVIEFELALDGQTRLEVYDANGRQLAVLVDGYMQPGRYRVEWDASMVSSGLYHYRLVSGEWSATRRMMVVK